MAFPEIKTPCVGVCSTVFGDYVCRGCRRFSHEVINWNAYTTQQKSLIVDRLNTLTEQVMSQRIIIEDASLLRKELDHQQIRYNTSLSPYSWAIEFIRALGKQQYPLEKVGLRIQSGYEGMSTKQLLDDINENLLELSQAWYEASFERAHKIHPVSTRISTEQGQDNKQE